MKRLTFVFAVLLAATITAAAQADSPKPSQAQSSRPSQPATQSSPTGQPAQSQTAQAPATLSSVVDREVSNYERLMVNAAEAMPEEKFNFNPASLNLPGAQFHDVRTFATLIKHTASANYFFWGAVSGEKPPENIKSSEGPEELKTKAEIIQFLKDSFAAGHRAAKMLTPENAFEQVQFLQFRGPRLYMATNAVIHCADEYGQMVEYLRMNGIVPPASAGR